MGFSFKRMFRHPFGSHSLFAKATQIASILPIPGAGLIGKAFNLMNRAHNTYDALSGRVAPILTAARAASFVPSKAPEGVMAGGTKLAKNDRPTRARSVGVRHRRRTTKHRRR